MINMVYLLAFVGAGIAIGLIMSLFYRNALKSQKDSIDTEKKKMVENALKEAESIKKEASLEAKDIVYQAKTDAEKELRERRSELGHLEKRLRQKEE
jgi:ribonuclease Y